MASKQEQGLEDMKAKRGWNMMNVIFFFPTCNQHFKQGEGRRVTCVKGIMSHSVRVREGRARTMLLWIST